MVRFFYFTFSLLLLCLVWIVMFRVTVRIAAYFLDVATAHPFVTLEDRPSLLQRSSRVRHIQSNQKLQYFFFESRGSQIIMIALYKFKIFFGKCMFVKQAGMRYIDEGVLKTGYKVNGTSDFANSKNWFEFADLEIGGLLFPYLLLYMFLDAVDCNFYEKRRQERRIFIAQLSYQHLQIAEGAIGDNSTNSTVLSRVKNDSGCTHAASPNDRLIHSVSLPHMGDHPIQIFSFIVTKRNELSL